MTAMTKLGTDFVTASTKSLELIGATETLWLTSRQGSAVRHYLKTPQLEALYEAAYLRIFTAWEDFLEEALVRFMAGRTTAAYNPVPVPGTSLFGTVSAARTALYGKKGYLLWHNADEAVKRCQKYLQNCPMELVLTGASPRLEMFASVRHRIAHSSTDARQKFQSGATRLTGTSHGDSAGRLLRAADISDPLNQPKWVRVITDDLQKYALQIAP